MLGNIADMYPSLKVSNSFHLKHKYFQNRNKKKCGSHMGDVISISGGWPSLVLSVVHTPKVDDNLIRFYEIKQKTSSKRFRYGFLPLLQ